MEISGLLYNPAALDPGKIFHTHRSRDGTYSMFGCFGEYKNTLNVVSPSCFSLIFNRHRIQSTQK